MILYVYRKTFRYCFHSNRETDGDHRVLNTGVCVCLLFVLSRRTRLYIRGIITKREPKHLNVLHIPRTLTVSVRIVFECGERKY